MTPDTNSNWCQSQALTNQGQSPELQKDSNISNMLRHIANRTSVVSQQPPFLSALLAKDTEVGNSMSSMEGSTPGF
ncbi:unnamed protein product [Lota lota]